MFLQAMDCNPAAHPPRGPKNSLSAFVVAIVAFLTIGLDVSFAATGRTAATFDVSSAGTAHYSIPIFTPRGSAGMTPQLALTYSSAAGDGLAGAGFAISGLSEITRCVKTVDQDGEAAAPNFTAADRFCLDGNRLRVVAGTYGAAGSEYRTEIETFTRITAYGTAGSGPSYFIAEQKSGLIFEYGNSPDSRVEPLAIGGGQTSTARTWGLNKIRDRAGNAIEVSYVEDVTYGAFRPNEIRWTSNPAQGLTAAYKAVFIYESAPRPDILYGYRFGNQNTISGQVTETKRLDRIDIYYNSTLVRRYELTYEPTGGAGARSRLQSVQECGLGGSDCFAPTNFTWISGSPSWNSEASTAQVVPTQPMVMDINRDGRDDLVYSSSATSGAGVWMYMLANSSGGFHPAVSTGQTNTHYSRALPLDWNGDGCWDFVVPNAANQWVVFQASGNGFSVPVNTSVGAGGQWWTADVNGDGRGDLVNASSNGFVQIHAHLSTGLGFATPFLLSEVQLGGSGTYGLASNAFGGSSVRARSSVRRPDFNGDGREDFVFVMRWISEPDPPNASQVAHYLCAVFSGNPGSSCAQIGSGLAAVPQAWFIGEATGDGLSDVFYLYNNTARLLHSRGDALLAGTSVSLAGYTPTAARSADWDGDGRDDLIATHSTTGALWFSRSNGSTLSALQSTGLVSGAGNFPSVGDVDGDGLVDLMRSHPSGSAWLYSTHQGVPGDRLDQATDGYGNFVNFDYTLLSQSHYTRYGDAVYPEHDYQGPHQIVSQFSASDGVGGSYTTSYWYWGARVRLTGRGFEGFDARRILDSRTTLRKMEFFHRVFPHSGALRRADVYQSDGTTLVSRSDSTWNAHTYGSGFDTRYLPYVSTATETSYEMGGSYNSLLVSTATTTNTVDSTTGTLRDSVTVVTEASSANGLNAGQSHTARTYHPALFTDVANWCIGRPATSQQVNSHTMYGGNTLTRTSSTSWDGLLCRPTQSIAQPGDSQWQVTTDLGYDGFGNVSSQTITGAGMAARSSLVSWGPTGQFPTTVTNALSQVTTKGWDYTLGVQTSETDPNSIRIVWQYDELGRRKRENRPDGTATTWLYADCASYGCVNANNKMALITTSLDATGGVIRDDYTYLDRFDRVLVNRSQTLSGAYNRTEREYDSSGRLSRTSAPCWWGSCTSSTSYWTRYTYDALSRPTQVSRPIDDSAGVRACAPGDASPPCQHSYVYYEGLTTRSIDPEGKQSKKIASAPGALSRSEDHAGYHQTFDYDAFGSVVRVSDNGTGTTTLQSATYNIRGARLSHSDADTGITTFTPNALGEVVSQTDALNKTLSFSYDALGRVTSRVMPECTSGTITTSFVWGTSAAARNMGRLQSHQISGCGQTTFRETFSYDSLGRLSQTDSLEGTAAHYYVNRSYSTSTGLPETITYPTSTQGYRLKVQYDYQHGIPVRTKDFNAPTTVFWQANASDARGSVVDETVGGVRTVRGFDSLTGLIDSIQTGPGGTATLQNLGYRWNRVGNLTQRQDLAQNLTEQFFYDNLHRLDYSTLNGTQNLDAAYDPRGNITSKTGVGTYTYSSSRVHAVTSVNTGSGTVNYLYSPNGQMKNRGGTELYYYADGLMKYLYKDASNSSLIAYTADGRRWSNAYIVAGANYAHRYIGDAAGTLYEKVAQTGGLTEHKHYIRGGDGSSVALYVRKQQNGTPTTYTNTLYHLLKDHLGSTDVVTTSNGGAVVRESYDAFGKRRGANWTGSPTASELNAIRDTTRRGFTSHESLDSLGLIHMNGRVFDPHIGRFVSADPYVPDPGLTQSFNRYSYVYNNPLSFTDPSGFETKREYLESLDDHGREAFMENMRDMYYRAYQFALFMQETSGGGGTYGSGLGCMMFTCSAGGILSGFQGAAFPGHWLDYTTSTRVGTDQGGSYVGLTSRRSRWVSGWQAAFIDVGHRTWSIGAGVGNWAMHSSPVIQISDAPSDYRWFKGPETVGSAGLVSASEHLVAVLAPMSRTGKFIRSTATTLSDAALVVRGGGLANQTAARIDEAVAFHPGAGVTGFSAQCNGGTCLAELGRFLRNKEVGVTTVGEIRRLGGDVIPTSGFGHHVTVTGVTGNAASPLFRVVPNPNPLVGP